MPIVAVIPLVTGCASLFGIGDLPPNGDAVDGGTSGDGGGSEPATTTGDGDAGNVLADGAVGSSAGDDARWPRWPMPADNPPLTDYQVNNHGDGATVIDQRTKLEWQDSVATTKIPHDTAIRYCDDLVYGGANDWRLPTRIELVSLLVIDATGATAAHPSAMSGASDSVENYWTSSVTDRSPENGYRPYWRVGVDGVDRVDDTEYDYARCVRGAPLGKHVTPSYDLDVDTVRDPATGLVWARSGSSQPRAIDADTYCGAQHLRNLPARVPTVKELQTIVDDELTRPASPPPFGDGADLFFSSSGRAVGSTIDLVHYVNFASGESDRSIDGSSPVRCVAGP